MVLLLIYACKLRKIVYICTRKQVHRYTYKSEYLVSKKAPWRN